MGNFSDAAAKNVADYYAGISAMPALPATWFVELHTADPGKDGLGFESGWGREAVTDPGGGEWTGTSPNYVNAAEVRWASVPSTQSITHFSIWDSVTAGTAYYVAAVTAGPVPVTAGQDAVMAAGQLGIGAD